MLETPKNLINAVGTPLSYVNADFSLFGSNMTSKSTFTLFSRMHYKKQLFYKPLLLGPFGIRNMQIYLSVNIFANFETLQFSFLFILLTWTREFSSRQLNHTESHAMYNFFFYFRQRTNIGTSFRTRQSKFKLKETGETGERVANWIFP